jgi:hypothetical protein
MGLAGCMWVTDSAGFVHAVQQKMNASLAIKLTTTCLKECVRKIMITKDSLNNDVPSREVRAIRLKRLEMCWLVSFFWNEEAKKSLDYFTSDQQALVGLLRPLDQAKDSRQQDSKIKCLSERKQRIYSCNVR